MTPQRAEAQKFILKYIGKIENGGKENVEIYTKLFDSMSDKQFDEFMTKIETGEEMLTMISPNLSKNMITVANNLKIGKELGHEFFQRIKITPKGGGRPYLTPKKYLVTYQTMRRQAQLLVKKISIPEDNRSINDLTGQPAATGKSRSSKISYPETQLLAADRLDNTAIELLKMRGGDLKAFVAMNQSISRTGGFSTTAIEKLGTRVKSTDTLRTFLTCMHFKVDL